MNKLGVSLNPKVTKLILQKFPVEAKRTALWYFKEELNNIKSCPNRTSKLPENVRPYLQSEKIKKTQISQIWHSLDPECKRKYFYLAESDEIRYKEQKSLRIARVIQLMVQHGQKFENVIESLPVADDPQEEVLLRLQKNHNYEHMLQLESTLTLYKNVIDHKDKTCSVMDSEDLITTVPKSFRPILSRPRRPPGSFMLFTNENKEKFFKLRDEQGISFCRIAAAEWRKLSEDERAKYTKKYNQLLDEYLGAMKQFKESDRDDYIERATREKKLFRKAMRRKLREHDVVPVNVRNAFNFFLMDNKNAQISKLSEIWRNMSEEDKQKYKLMNQKDSERYYAERVLYAEMAKSLDQLLSPRNSNRLLREQNGDQNDSEREESSKT